MISGISIAELSHGLIFFIILVCSLALHEWGHAIMADKLGDDTPRSQGRVTTNPLVHIDPLGTILIPLLGAFGFFGSFAMIGWAKPIYTNPSNFRRGMYDQAWVTIAGPGVNFFLALIAVIAAAVADRFSWGIGPLLIKIYSINISLVVFNLLPIPPLDGSKFLMYWFGMSEESYARFSTWGGVVLLVLINISAFRAFVGFLIGLASVPFNLLYGIIA
ncbi:MAG: site-2 protease family protein [Verrucomicrobia bacterium]|nr:site-2 protease family protein [Verrucomicrobiota bacterium]